MSICKDCIHYGICDPYVAPNESFLEVGGCKCFVSTADVVEVRHGTWYHGTENGAVYAKCSACGRKMNYSCYGYAYCALCGAKMDGEGREE